MIEKKHYICDCGAKSFGFKNCISCRSKKYAENSKKRNAISISDNVQEDKSDLDSYFDEHIKAIEKYSSCCENCHKKISKPTRWNVAHILPKSIFKSVRSLSLNSIYLCRDCHGQFDSSFTNAQKMKVWITAKKRVGQFIHIVKEKHKILEQYKN
jgi:5-methylcytosine-specific restriction endonuclease McrA